MENRVGDIVDKIVEVDTWLMGTLAALGTKIAFEQVIAVFTA